MRICCFFVLVVHDADLSDFRHPFSVFSMFGSTIMRITYGIEVDEPGNESYLALVEEALAIFSAATVPGKYLVETFPVLRHVPAWFPFAKFKREAKAWKAKPLEVLHRPWEVAVNAIVSDNVKLSWFMHGRGS